MGAIVGGTHHAAPRTDSPMELAMPIAVNRYGLTWRNRNPRYHPASQPQMVVKRIGVWTMTPHRRRLIKITRA